MPDLTVTLSRAALVAAVDCVLEHTLRFNFTDCRNLKTLTAECGGGCQNDLDFLKAARDAGISIENRWREVRRLNA